MLVCGVLICLYGSVVLKNLTVRKVFKRCTIHVLYGGTAVHAVPYHTVSVQRRTQQTLETAILTVRTFHKFQIGTKEKIMEHE